VCADRPALSTYEGMRAIVNITCPYCGGRVDGIESLGTVHRIPCPYCRTELHVPRVGEHIVERREVVHHHYTDVPRMLHDGPSDATRIASAIIMIVLAFVMAIYFTTCSDPTSHAMSIDDWRREGQLTPRASDARATPDAP
jgi:hypothetical protein